MSYYEEHRKDQLQKRKEYYRKKTGTTRRYKKGYLITFPDGHQVIKETEVSLSLFMGYSSSYLRRVMQNNKIVAGCKIERIYG